VIRVLHLISGLRVGGAEILLLDTLRRIDRSRFDARVASLLGPGAMGPRFEEAGIRVINLSNAGRFSWRCSARLRRHLREHPCDILHGHLLHATLVARWLRKRRAVQHLVTTQHFPPLERGPGFPRRLHRWTARWDDMTIAVSPSVAEELTQRLGADPARVRVIENGVDLSRFHPGVEPLPRDRFDLSDEHRVIGVTASLTSKKGIDVLLRAAPDVIRQEPRVRLLIAGEGPERERLESLSSEIGIRDQVQLVGNIAEIERLLPMLDVLCLPSRREPFGLSVAEAMAAGCAVVHTAVGGLASLSEDGVSALQVPPDDPDALAKALLHVLGDHDLAGRLRANATRRARERFDIAQTVEKTEALWEEMVS
jgi:glycosyltransferase involved in cell wall biosynthesis